MAGVFLDVKCHGCGDVIIFELFRSKLNLSNSIAKDLPRDSGVFYWRMSDLRRFDSSEAKSLNLILFQVLICQYKTE